MKTRVIGGDLCQSAMRVLLLAIISTLALSGCKKQECDAIRLESSKYIPDRPMKASDLSMHDIEVVESFCSQYEETADIRGRDDCIHQKVSGAIAGRIIRGHQNDVFVPSYCSLPWNK